MKIVIAIDSFKGCCSTITAAEAVERGLSAGKRKLEIVKVPVADGGEGTVDVLVYGLNGSYKTVKVLDPIGRLIESSYGILPDRSAVIEMASASGLPLLEKREYDPLKTTTFGTGQMIKDALEAGCRKIYIGLGGSATNDGGVGMAQALGASFRDANGIEIGYGGGELGKIRTIDLSRMDPRVSEAEFIGLSDVTSPLCGPQGASVIFGPQKGAGPAMVNLLDSNLYHYGQAIEVLTGIDVINAPGSGAGGGIGAGLMAFCNAKIQSGVNTILDTLNFDHCLKDAHLVITGEGRIDLQTAAGKLPVGIAGRAAKYGIPVIAIVGSVGEGAEVLYEHGIDAMVSIVNKPMPLEESLMRGVELIEKAATNIIKILEINDRGSDKTGLHDLFEERRL